MYRGYVGFCSFIFLTLLTEGIKNAQATNQTSISFEVVVATIIMITRMLLESTEAGTVPNRQEKT